VPEWSAGLPPRMSTLFALLCVPQNCYKKLFKIK
jgi:hypothetical protein